MSHEAVSDSGGKGGFLSGRTRGIPGAARPLQSEFGPEVLYRGQFSLQTPMVSGDILDGEDEGGGGDGALGIEWVEVGAVAKYPSGPHTEESSRVRCPRPWFSRMFRTVASTGDTRGRGVVTGTASGPKGAASSPGRAPAFSPHPLPQEKGKMDENVRCLQLCLCPAPPSPGAGRNLNQNNTGP